MTKDPKTEPAMKRAARGGPPTALAEFLRSHPAEARRQDREAKHDARWNARRRAYSENAEAGAAPRGTRAHAGQRKTGMQRAAAWAKGELGLSRSAFYETVCVASSSPKEIGRVEMHRPSLEELGLLLEKESSRTPDHPTLIAWDRLVGLIVTANVLTAAHAFYLEIRRAFRSRADLKVELARWTHRPTKIPRTLRKAWTLAAIGPHVKGRFKALGRERGKGAGGEQGSARVEVALAGQFKSLKNSWLDEARAVEIDLLSPELLTMLYGAGRHCGPKEAAKVVAAKIVGRSRAQVENEANDVHALGVDPGLLLSKDRPAKVGP